jgi:recombination protein RecA
LVSDDILKFLKKHHGEKIYSMGSELKEGEKVSTGIFPIDFMLGGGIPLGKITHIYGPKDAAKTTLALSITGELQRAGKKCFYVDTENTFDPNWADTLGIDLNNLMVFQPANGEQIVDIVDGLLNCDDIDFGVIDSLGAIITTNEIESYGDKQIVAGSSSIITKILRKAIHAQLEQSKKEYYPTLLCVNQVRQKIGVLYGNPEYAPGGAMVEHAPSLNLRITGKPVIYKEVNPNVAIKHQLNLTVKKSKMKTVLNHIEFEIGLQNVGSIKAGKNDDADLMLKYLKSFNLLGKLDTTIICLGREYTSQKALKEDIVNDNEWKMYVQQQLIETGQVQFGEEQMVDE